MGLIDTTQALTYARNQLIKVGVSFTFDTVANMIYATALCPNLNITGTDPGRQMYWQFTATGVVAAGKQLQGLQIKSTFNGSGDDGSITGAEIKARHTTDNTATVVQLRGLVGNADTKNATTTTAYGVEGSIDVGAGGTITTSACFHGNLNNSGTVTTSYGAYLEGVSGYNLTYGVYVIYATTGIYIGASTTGINVGGTCTSAINVSAVQTDSGGLDETCVFKHGTWDTPLAYGVMDGHTVFKSVSITASSDSYIMGDLFKLTTTASSAGTLVGHYNYITVAHTTASTYCYYGRLVMSTDATITNAECMLLTVNVNSGVTLGTTGHLSGLHVAMTIDAAATDIATAVETVGVYVQTSGIAKDVTGSTVGIKVEKGGGGNYLDYGLQFSNQFENCTAVEHFQLTQGNAAIAMLIETGGHTCTSAITLSGKVLYCFDFDNADDGYGFDKTTTEKNGNVVGHMIVKDQDGSKAVINVYAP